MTDPVMIALMGECRIVSPCATLGGGDCGYKAQRGGEADPEFFFVPESSFDSLDVFV